MYILRLKYIYITHTVVFSKDLRYKAILSRIQKTRKMWEEGKMKDLDELDGKDRAKVLRKKSLGVNDRGRKSIEVGTRTERLSLVWLEE